MIETIICPTCGATTSTKTGMCEYCGSALLQIHNEQSSPKAQQYSKQDREVCGEEGTSDIEYVPTCYYGTDEDGEWIDAGTIDVSEYRKGMKIKKFIKGLLTIIVLLVAVWQILRFILVQIA